MGFVGPVAHWGWVGGFVRRRAHDIQPRIHHDLRRRQALTVLCHRKIEVVAEVVGDTAESAVGKGYLSNLSSKSRSVVEVGY